MFPQSTSIIIQGDSGSPMISVIKMKDGYLQPYLYGVNSLGDGE